MKNNFLVVLILVFIFKLNVQANEDRSCPYLILDKKTNNINFLDFYLSNIDADVDIKELEDLGNFKKELNRHPFFGDPRLKKMKQGISDKLNEIYLQVPELAEQLNEIILNKKWKLRNEEPIKHVPCINPTLPIYPDNFELIPLIQLENVSDKSSRDRKYDQYTNSIWANVFLTLKPKIQVATIFHKILNEYFNSLNSTYTHSDNGRDLNKYTQRAQDAFGFLFSMNENSSILNYMAQMDDGCKICGYTPKYPTKTTPQVPYLRYTWNQPLEYSFPDQQTVYIKYLSYGEFQKSKKTCSDIERNMSVNWPRFIKKIQTMNNKIVSEINQYKENHPSDPNLMSLSIKNYALAGEISLATNQGRDFTKKLSPLSFMEFKYMQYSPQSYILYNNTQIEIDWTKIINFEEFKKEAMNIKEQYQKYIGLAQRCTESKMNWDNVEQFKHISIQ